MPIIINGVYERYLFRKEKEQSAQSFHDHDHLLGLLESFQAAISSLSHVVNNSLALLSLNIHEYSQSLLPHVEADAKETFKIAFQELDKEYNLIASSVKTMLNLTAAMRDKLKGGATTSTSESSLNDQIETLKKDHEERMRL